MLSIPKIVGIGASAGGLEAINDFFDNIPKNTGLAFVVIQHLSPDFKSLMDELLSKHTEMPIQVIDSNIRIQPNHIYLISASNNIIVEHGMIKQIKRDPKTKLNFPIDVFFHSLGRDQGAKSIGVILSGTGTDGSRGIKTIKEAGGLVYVQDPDTAQFDGMPLSSAHLADNVLSPSDIALEIAAIIKTGRNGDGLSINIENEEHKKLFHKILERVEEVAGANFTDYRSKTLVRRMEKRMYLNHFNDLNEFYLHLTNSRQETQLLFKEFLIGVTRFFRDTEAFEVFSNRIIPHLVSNVKEGKAIRIWVPGCSTGAEAYSLAILLTDYNRRSKTQFTYKIFASDIDDEAIKLAIRGRFHEEIRGDVPPPLLERYFDKREKQYYIKKEIRENIVFTVHNAIQDPPFINIDLISCRNMIIYLNAKAQQSIMTNFLFSLKLNGILFLGPSESLNSAKEFYSVINSKWNFYKKAIDERPVPVSKFQAIKRKHMINQKKSQYQNYITSATINQDDVFARMLSSRYAPKAIFVNGDLDILYFNGDLENILSFPREFARMNLAKLVDPSVEWLFTNGVRRALQSEKTLRYNDIQIQKKQKVVIVDTTFNKTSFQEFEHPLVVITFDIKGKKRVSDNNEELQVIQMEEFKEERLKALEHELREIKKDKQKLVEQLGTINEELQSSNEELLASNEELQSTNEELQSVNEELYTVNLELQTKIKELVISNNDINNLLRSTQIGTIFLDENLNIRKFTPALKDQFNLKESDIGRPITDFTNTLNYDKIYSEIEKVVNDIQSVEKEIKDKNGHYYLMRILPYKTENGIIDGVVITFIDINELKNVYLEQERASEQYKVLFENSHDIISLTDEKGVVKATNFESLGSLKRRDLIGSNLLNLISTEDRNITKNAIKQLKQDLMPQRFETRWKSKDNKEHWFYNTLSPIIIKNEVKNITWISRDITESRAKEMKLTELSRKLETQIKTQAQVLSEKNIELEEMNAYLDAFVHGAAHDLRSPISRMKGMIDLLPDINTPEQKDQVFKSVQDGIQSLDVTLNGLIEMVEFQKNTEKLITNIDLKQVYSEVVKQLKPEIKEAEASITTQFEEDTNIHYIKAYATSVLYNLLNNAIKYRSYDRELKIDVRLKKQDNYLVLRIQDNGIGIDMNRYGHFLFKPFKRLTVERQGTGIGLSIINNAVRKNGGRIEVKSNLNKGAIFTVYFKPYVTK